MVGDWKEGRLKSEVGLLVPVLSFLAALIEKAPPTHFLAARGMLCCLLFALFFIFIFSAANWKKEREKGRRLSEKSNANGQPAVNNS